MNEENIFKEQQQHMYTILENYLKIEFGKTLLKQYITTWDAQAIYHALSTFALKFILETITPPTAFCSDIIPISNLKFTINEIWHFYFFVLFNR